MARSAYDCWQGAAFSLWLISNLLVMKKSEILLTKAWQFQTCPTTNPLKFLLVITHQIVKEISWDILEELIDPGLSRRLLSFYTWMNSVTECLYGIQLITLFRRMAKISFTGCSAVMSTPSGNNMLNKTYMRHVLPLLYRDRRPFFPRSHHIVGTHVTEMQQYDP